MKLNAGSAENPLPQTVRRFSLAASVGERAGVSHSVKLWLFNQNRGIRLRRGFGATGGGQMKTPTAQSAPAGRHLCRLAMQGNPSSVRSGIFRPDGALDLCDWRLYKDSAPDGASVCCGRILKQFVELVLGDARLADEGAERAFSQFAVVGHGQTPARSLAQDDMAAGLVVHLVSELPESFDGVCAGADGQAAHRATSTISSATGPGTSSLCFSKLWR